MQRQGGGPSTDVAPHDHRPHSGHLALALPRDASDLCSCACARQGRGSGLGAALPGTAVGAGAGWALARSSVLGDIPGRQSGTAARGAGRGGPSALSASEPTHRRRVLLGPPAGSRRGAWEAPGPRRGDKSVWCWHVQAAADPAVPVGGRGGFGRPAPPASPGHAALGHGKLAAPRAPRAGQRRAAGRGVAGRTGLSGEAGLINPCVKGRLRSSHVPAQGHWGWGTAHVTPAEGAMAGSEPWPLLKGLPGRTGSRQRADAQWPGTTTQALARAAGTHTTPRPAFRPRAAGPPPQPARQATQRGHRALGLSSQLEGDGGGDVCLGGVLPDGGETAD